MGRRLAAPRRLAAGLGAAGLLALGPGGAALAAVISPTGLPPAVGAREGSDPGFPQSAVRLAVTGPRRADATLTIEAAGTNAAHPGGGGYGLDLLVTDPARLPGGCLSSDAAEVARIATVAGGGLRLTTTPLPEGARGRFSLVEPYEPLGSGPLQLCAYSRVDGDDAAWAQTEVTIAPALLAPRVRVRPRVVRHGSRLSCTRGSWSGSPSRFRFAWRVGEGAFGPPRAGAGYRLTAADQGRSASCAVDVSGPGGSARAYSRRVRV